MSTIQRGGGHRAAAPDGSQANAIQTSGSCCGPGGGSGRVGGFLPVWLAGTRGLILGAVVGVGVGLAFGWPTLVALGVAPILLSVLPCAVMCGLGMCVMGKRMQSNSAQTPAQQSPGVDQ